MAGRNAKPAAIGKRRKAVPGPPIAGAAKAPAKAAAVKLRPPGSTVVVITLRPGAEEKGVTYTKVLLELKAKVDLIALGIPGIRPRLAATGSWILELPGAQSGPKADILAQKLREVLDAETVRVSRPTMCADLRISGLDVSVSAEEVVAAIAQRGGCPPESVKAGALRPGFRGTNTVRVSCPMAAAKKVGSGGRLLIGWVAAQVSLLQPRPLQCFRCLHKGHVSAKCTSEVDRSGECYRCGQEGHKAAECPAAGAKCSLCSAAGKPAGHRVGSKACCPPKPKAAARVGRPCCPPTPTPGGEEAMVTNQG